MKKLAYLIIAASVLSGCSGRDEGEKELSGQAPAVNTSSLKVDQVVGVGKVEPEGEIVSLAAQTGGVVKEIVRKDGESVAKGDAILRLDDELEQIKVLELKSQYQAQKAQAAIDEASLGEAEIKLANKSRLLESVRNLAEKGAETIQVLDDLDTEVKTLRMALERSRSAVALSQNRLQELDAQVKYALAEAGRKVLRSPFDGILLETHVKEGAAVSQYSSFAEIAPAGKTMVRAEVDELFAGRLKTGQKAEIRYIGSDEVIASGSLFFLSPYLKKKALFSEKASEQEDRLVREVKIMLDGSPELILNSKVECVILL